MTRSWDSDPLVRRAIEANPDLDPLGIVLELHRLMTVLEEKFPGTPFRDIYRMADEAPRARDRARIRRKLSATGVPREAIELICPKVASVRQSGYEEFKRLVNSGKTATELITEGAPREQAERAARCRHEPTEEELEIAAKVLDHPENKVSQVAREYGMGQSKLVGIVYKVRYWRELELAELELEVPA